MQALYLLALEPIAETMADKNSYGFRPYRSCADAIELCFKALARGNGARWILEADIKGCFDNISHEWMLQNIPTEKRILKQWLKAGIVESNNLFPTKKGTPQGGIISPTLANMVLDGLEDLIYGTVGIHYDKGGRKRGTKVKVNFVRYADDFIVTGLTPEILTEKVQPVIEQFLAERGLELSKAKTKITHIDDGFDFLGQNVRKYNGKLLTKPSKANIKSVKKKIRNIIHDNKTATAFSLIKKLNPVIRGWTNYHRHKVSSDVFSSLDNYIFKLLWNWCVRRHPTKGKRWIKRKYFKSIGRSNWVFSGELSGEKARLINAIDTRIRRHVIIRRGTNPFDADWETYFEYRISYMMMNWFGGFKMLPRLWKSQKGNCPVCGVKITAATKWHIHHIQPKHLGGQFTFDNLIMLHPDCHRQVHSQNIQVTKPCYDNKS